MVSFGLADGLLDCPRHGRLDLAGSGADHRADRRCGQQRRREQPDRESDGAQAGCALAGAITAVARVIGVPPT